MLEHARQVQRLLPGGLAIVGLLTICNRDVDVKLITPVLDEISLSSTPGQGLVWVHQNATRYIGRLYLSNNQGLQGIEVKTGTLPRLEKISCLLNIGIEIPESGDVQNSIQKLLNTWSAQLSTYKIRINGVSKESTQIGSIRQNSDNYILELYTLSPGHVVKSKSSVIRVNGFIECQALVTEKMTINDCFLYIKQDAVNSLKSRIELLADELMALGSDFFVGEIDVGKYGDKNLAQRVFWDVGVLSLCDYLVPGETAEVSQERLRTLLGVSVEGPQSREVMSAAPQVQQRVVAQPRDSGGMGVYIGLALVVVVLAIIVKGVF